MELETALNEKLCAIRAMYRDRTGTDLQEASLWFYGDKWVVFLTAGKPRYENHSATAKTWAEIDKVAAEVVEVLAHRILRKPSAAEIAVQVGVSEDELCQIVCAARHTEAA